MLFGRKKKKEDEIDAAFERVYTQIHKIDDWDNPKKLEHYILDSCEHIISTTKEIEGQKTEYRMLTSYLNDISILTSLPPEEDRELKSLAKSIVSLTRAKEQYMMKDPLIPDDVFYRMQENEDSIPEAIERLKEHEAYQASIEKDLKYLEAEKDRLTIEYDGVKGLKSFFRIFSVIVLFAFAALLVIAFSLSSKYDTDRLLIVIFLFGALAAAALILGLTSGRSHRRKTVRKLNDSISLLNVERMKYANVEKAIRYFKDRYEVNSAAELSYLFDCYNRMVAEQEKNDKDNVDLEDSYRAFLKLLDGLDLYDRKIWIKQLKAILNPSDMELVKNNLIKRRQGVREQIRANTKLVKSERDEIDRLMREHKYYVPEIMEIIESVDKLCGTGTTGKAGDADDDID